MNKHFNIVDQTKISTGEVYRTSESFIVFNPNPDLRTQSMEEMQEMGAAVDELRKGEQLPYITDISNAEKFSRQEKELALERLKVFSSAAFVSNKSVSKVILSIMLLFHRTEPKIKVFSTIEEAKKWSNQFNK